MILKELKCKNTANSAKSIPHTKKQNNLAFLLKAQGLKNQGVKKCQIKRRLKAIS
jgi:hypothetical protein